jgi:Branched-chain amino acid transport protein (AzlD)
MLVAHSGLAWWWASVFSCVIFAGSFEFPALHRPGAVARQRRRRLSQRPHAARRHGDPARLHPPGLPLADPARALPDVLALAATAGLHLWRRNAVLSILGGTAIHVVLTAALPAH